MAYFIKCVMFCIIYYVIKQGIKIFIVDRVLPDMGLVQIHFWPRKQDFPMRVLDIVLSITYPINLLTTIMYLLGYLLVSYSYQRNYKRFEEKIAIDQYDTDLQHKKKIYTMVSIIKIYQRDAYIDKYATLCNNVYDVDGKKRYMDYPDDDLRYEMITEDYVHPYISQDIYYLSKAYVAARMEIMGTAFYQQPTKTQKERILKMRDGILKQLKKSTICEM